MNGEIVIGKERNFLSSLPAAFWFLFIMMSELNPTAPATSIGAQRFGEQFGIFLGPVIGGLLIPVLGYKGAILSYGVIMVAGSVVFPLEVPEPKRLKVV